MSKIILAIVLCFFTLPIFAKSDCPQALPTNHKNFCASFKKSAICHCSDSLPDGMCQNMDTLYSRMISVFGSLEKACEYQKDTATQTCIDDWNCYRKGGKDSQGRSCSSTGKKCP